MKYYVYEDRPAKEAILHVGVCGYCNEGKGCHEYYEENLSGKWHGPFICLEQAEWAATKIGGRIIRCRCVRK